MDNTKLTQDSNDYKYLKSYNELVKYALPKMNKKSNYLSRGYIEYDIYV